MNSRFRQWLDGGLDEAEMIRIMDASELPDRPREEIRQEARQKKEEFLKQEEIQKEILASRERTRWFYIFVAVLSCVCLIGVLLGLVAHLPRFGVENPLTMEVVTRYVEEGLEETGAVNIVSGMILDYRAFDTLGESNVLFTALVCVLILLRADRKNMQAGREDYYKIRSDQYYDLSHDAIMRFAGMVLMPCIVLYGMYVILNGQNGPGGGFSGGAVMGAGLILSAAAFGFDTVDRIFTLRLSNIITFVSLSFYSLAKGYVFFMGANGYDNHIPKGTPGAILSGGMILPLDIAVGIVVACTMFGFYSLFRRGCIGGKTE